MPDILTYWIPTAEHDFEPNPVKDTAKPSFYPPVTTFPVLYKSSYLLLRTQVL